MFLIVLLKFIFYKFHFHLIMIIMLFSRSGPGGGVRVPEKNLATGLKRFKLNIIYQAAVIIDTSGILILVM